MTGPMRPVLIRFGLSLLSAVLLFLSVPRFGLERRTTTGSPGRAAAAATSPVPSMLPSSTTMISAGSPRRLAYSITRGSVPGSRRASLYAGTTIDSPEPSLPQPSFC